MTDFLNKGVWSAKSAEKWEDGYIVGNGALGGILFGSPNTFSVVANHHTLFLKQNKMDNIPDMSDHLDSLRAVIETEGYQKGVEYFEEVALEKGYHGLTMSDPYHPGSEIQLGIKVDEKSITDFKRQLDYEKGLAIETFSITRQRFKKTLFCSKANRALYLKVESTDPFDVVFSLKDYQNPELNQDFDQLTDCRLVQKSTYLDQTSYVSNLDWTISEGTVAIFQDQVEIKQTRAICFALSIHPEAVINPIDDFEQIQQAHIQEFQSTYNQVSLTLVDDEERRKSLDEIVEEMHETHTVPLVLYEKLYDASRYVIQSMTGEALPNLQGIWGGDFSPAWSGDYTLDTNVQLAIASLASLGLFEQFDGLFKKMADYDEDFKENAARYYGCRGYLMPVHASTRALHVHWNSEWPMVLWTAGAGWMSHFYDEYFEYTQDKNFLNEVAIPFYVETLLFYEDFLTIQEGKVHLRPSYSAENGMGDTATMDIAVIKETIWNLQKAYQLLDEPVPEKYETLLTQLPDYMIDSEGILKEWIDETKAEHFNHRHFSNLYPVFQSKEIDQKSPVLWEAANKAFDKRIEAWLLSEDGDTSSSHGRIHAAMCGIALERPNEVEAALRELVINESFFPSLATAHYNQAHVFNVDANGSYPKVLHDALIYTEADGVLTLFKAMPSWLSKGSLKGIRLPKNIRVEQLEWDLVGKEKTCRLTLQSDLDQTVMVQLQSQYTQGKINNEEVKIVLTNQKAQTIDLQFTMLEDVSDGETD
ncbi:glycoside hydrolase N-terminal domain-containing protein [Marinilactibacillus sp. XAAS-LB27]|uniref:glycosyl hydrolase family 95 catalytic domain-containing protein n=1 Tax=Marinilactibacillus sp. XAAS-LB27 TaxID=3114538 RepID=UPI002E17BC13|nr:glycoside hydrolase N-terminal domain-containing protein [Marinilactibacillus sp. XAAS-LB27]